MKKTWIIVIAVIPVIAIIAVIAIYFTSTYNSMVAQEDCQYSMEQRRKPISASFRPYSKSCKYSQRICSTRKRDI